MDQTLPFIVSALPLYEEKPSVVKQLFISPRPPLSKKNLNPTILSAQTLSLSGYRTGPLGSY